MSWAFGATGVTTQDQVSDRASEYVGSLENPAAGVEDQINAAVEVAGTLMDAIDGPVNVSCSGHSRQEGDSTRSSINVNVMEAD